MPAKRIAAFVFAVALLSQGVAFSQISEFRASLNELKNSWHAEQDAIKKIKELGGWVELKDCVPSKWHNQIPESRRKFVVEVNMVYHVDKETGERSDNRNYSDKCLEAIGKFSQVKRILLQKGQATDESLRHITNLRHVEVFYVWDAEKVSDEGLKHLANYRKLTSVHISNGKITAKGIAYLSNSNEMKKLSLQGNRFTNEILNIASRFKKLETLWVGRGENTINDKGLFEYVPKLKNLKTFSVQKCQATDAGLKPLFAMPNLEQVYITGVDISPDKVNKLQEIAKQRKLENEKKQDLDSKGRD